MSRPTAGTVGSARRMAPLAQTSDAEIVAALAQALAAGGRPRRRLRHVRPPALHSRSTVYFIGDADRPGLGPQWVVKRPDDRTGQEDLANPLSARQQFDALRVLADHFEHADPRLRVVRPVALLPEVGAFAMEYAP